MSAELYTAYLVACAIVVVVPGPTATLIVANSLTHGTRAGLLNVVGTQFGLAVMIGIVIVGLAPFVEIFGRWFDWIRLLGAAYLVWLGLKLVRSSGGPNGTSRPAIAPLGGFLLQGLLVAVSNPKALLFFGAFIPQFVDPRGDYFAQVSVLGLTAMAFAAVADGSYALVAGRARATLSRRAARLLSRVGGGFLIGGGLWLAFSRSR